MAVRISGNLSLSVFVNLFYEMFNDFKTELFHFHIQKKETRVLIFELI